MAAYDNVSLPGAPNIATAGNFAQQLYSMLSALPQDYQKGQDFQYQQRQRNLFQDGVPQNKGQTDFAGMLQKMIQAGGSPVAGQMLSTLQKQPFFDEALRQMKEDGGQPQQPNIGPATSTHAGPANITGDFGGQGGGRAQVSQTSGGDRINNLAADRNVDLDSFLRKYPTAQGLMDRDLTPTEAENVGKLMDRFKGGTAGNTTKPVVSTGYEQDENNTNEATPVGSTGGAQISPNPQGAGPGRGETFDSRFNAAQGGGRPEQDPAAGIVPPGFKGDSRDFAAAARKRAEALRKQANTQAIIGIPTKAKEDQAAAFDKQADAIDAAWAERGKLTGEQKNIRTPAVAAAKTAEEARKADIESSKKKYDGLQNLGQVGQIGNQKLDRIRAVMSDPSFMSGAGHSIAQAFKQWNVTLGGDPKAAQPMEEFNKTAQQLLTDDIKAMGQSGAGPVRVAEVNIMKQATANLGISPATNRYLVEEAYRVHNDNIAVARMAQQYKAQHGYLDAGWDKVRDQYYEQHPLFSKAELADPRLVSPPMVPREIAADPGKRTVWEKQQGLKSGDPIRTDDGKIRWVR